MCLIGTGSQATAFIIDRQTLLNPCNMITPTIDELQECSNKDKVKAVNAPAEGGLVTYPGAASFLPAPWLRGTVMSSGTSNYAKLITEVNAAALNLTQSTKKMKITLPQQPSTQPISSFGRGEQATDLQPQPR